MKRCLCFLLCFLGSSLMAQNTGTTVINSTNRPIEEISGNRPNPEGLRPVDPRKFAVSIGILQGGSLLGVDLEALLSQRLGLQIGFGTSSIYGGLNLHFKPTINSSFINLGVQQLGLGNSAIATSFGPTYVFRAKRIFTASVGWGYIINKGVRFREVYNENVVMLFNFSVGVYFPF